MPANGSKMNLEILKLRAELLAARLALVTAREYAKSGQCLKVIAAIEAVLPKKKNV